MNVDTSLAAAVERFALRALELPDAVLERDLAWRGNDTDLRWHFFVLYAELHDLAVSIAAQRVAEGNPPTMAHRLLVHWQAAYRDLQALLLGLRDEELDRVPAEGEWPLRSVLEHLMGVERRFLAITGYALQRYRAGEPPQAMPEEKFEPLRRSDDAAGSLAQILATYAALHEQVLVDLAGVADDELAAPLYWWYNAGVRFQLGRFDAHLREHTIQAEKVLEAIRPRPADARRTVRLLYAALADAEGAALGAATTASERRRELIAAFDRLGEQLAE